MKQTGAGDLDQRVRIERRDSSALPGGGYADAWVAVATVWAQVWPVSGRERAEAQQMEASTMMRFKIRYRAGIAADMRIVWQGRAHNIRFVADAGSRAPFVTIDAEAGVAV